METILRSSPFKNPEELHMDQETEELRIEPGRCEAPTRNQMVKKKKKSQLKWKNMHEVIGQKNKKKNTVSLNQRGNTSG